MTTSISTAAQNQFIRARILEIQRQMTVLQEQVSSGKKSTVFSGISEVSSLSLQLNNAKKATNEFLDNISKARTRIQPIQQVMQRINDIAAEVRNDALVASSDALDATKGNGALKALAQQRLNEIVSLLNIRVDTDYLFAGRASSNPPMQNFGSVDQAGTILGQVAGLNVTYPLGATAASGSDRYDAIRQYLANSITREAPGGTAPAPYGFSGETGAPGGNEYRFTVQTTAAAGATTVTVAQGFDLPKPGQYIEFGGTVQNAAYQVQSVNTATRTITFTRFPATQVGLDFAVPAGSSVNVTSPAAVQQVVDPNNAATADTVGAGGAAIGATTIPVTTIATYTVGDRIEIAGVFYDVTGVNTGPSTIDISRVTVGGGLAAAVAAGAAINQYDNYPAGSTSIRLDSVASVTAGMSLKFSNSSATYSVVSVNSATNTIEITAESTSSGQGLETAIPPPATGVDGGEVTVQFGDPVERLSVRIDNGIDLEYGIRGDNPAIRKVLDALFALATTDLDTTTSTGFREVARLAAEDLNTGRSMVADLAAELGVKENVLDTTETRHKDFLVVLDTQLDRAENVDMADAVTRLMQTQASLEASYKLLASLRNLSLAQFL